MARTLIGQLLLIGAAAAAVAIAPTAGAEVDRGCLTEPTCSDESPNFNAPNSPFSTGIPQGRSNDAQFVQPGSNPYGAGPHPPLLALD